MTRYPLVVGITGASGAIYAQRLLDVLLRGGQDVHLSISPSGQAVIRQELEIDVPLDSRCGDCLVPTGTAESGTLTYHHYTDFMTPIASGSYRTSGMIICPCSGSTLSSVVTGASNNLIQRAADVHLKERRKLILVPRETPLSLVHLENMKRAVEAGAVVLPAAPGWYHGVQKLEDLVDFVVARILDQLGIDNRLIQRWGNP